MGPNYQKSDTYRIFSQLDEVAEQTRDLGPWYYRENAEFAPDLW